jgi:hypothetical protein
LVEIEVCKVGARVFVQVLFNCGLLSAFVSIPRRVKARIDCRDRFEEEFLHDRLLLVFLSFKVPVAEGLDILFLFFFKLFSLLFGIAGFVHGVFFMEDAWDADLEPFMV